MAYIERGDNSIFAYICLDCDHTSADTAPHEILTHYTALKYASQHVDETQHKAEVVEQRSTVVTPTPPELTIR